MAAIPPPAPGASHSPSTPLPPPGPPILADSLPSSSIPSLQSTSPKASDGKPRARPATAPSKLGLDGGEPPPGTDGVGRVGSQEIDGGEPERGKDGGGDAQMRTDVGGGKPNGSSLVPTIIKASQIQLGVGKLQTGKNRKPRTDKIRNNKGDLPMGSKSASPLLRSPIQLTSSPGVNMLARSVAVKRASVIERVASIKRANPRLEGERGKEVQKPQEPFFTADEGSAARVRQQRLEDSSTLLAMAAVAETTVEAAADGSDLRSFLAKRGVDTAEVDDRALKELEEKYIIARDLDADTVLSKIQDLLGLGHKEDTIVAYEGLSYQIPSRGLEQQEYEPLLRQLCLRRDKVYCCAVSDPKTSRWAKIITAVLSLVQELLLSGSIISSDFMRCRYELFKRDKKTVDDALLDICCLLECTRTSLGVFEMAPGTVVGPLKFTMKNGKEMHCMARAGAWIAEEMHKVTAKPGAEIKFILVVQRNAIFEDFARGLGDRFLREFGCVILTGGDGQPNVTTRAFLHKLKDSLAVPVYALVDPDPKGLSIFCTYKFGSSEMPFDNAGLTVPEIKLIGVYLDEAIGIEKGQPLTKEDKSILMGLCSQKHVMDDELLRTNIVFMMHRGLKSKIEALYRRQYPPSDYIRKAINNQEDI